MTDEQIEQLAEVAYRIAEAARQMVMAAETMWSAARANQEAAVSSKSLTIWPSVAAVNAVPGMVALAQAAREWKESRMALTVALNVDDVDGRNIREARRRRDDAESALAAALSAWDEGSA